MLIELLLACGCAAAVSALVARREVEQALPRLVDRVVQKLDEAVETTREAVTRGRRRSGGRQQDGTPAVDPIPVSSPARAS